MPVMDGVTATRFIRQLDHRAANIPIIAMSANVLPDQVRRYEEFGMSDHIGKPFKRSELLGALNNWLAKTHRRVANGRGTGAQMTFSLSRRFARLWACIG